MKPDALPWSDILNSTTDIWLPPHPCHTECWHKDPVEVAARRYERAGRFQDASKLRVDFRGLNILHRRAFQWYRWAEKQSALNGSSWLLSCDVTRPLIDRQILPKGKHWIRTLSPQIRINTVKILVKLLVLVWKVQNLVLGRHFA